MKKLCLFTAMLLLIPGTALADEKDQAATAEKKICRTEKMTGSLTRRTRICLTEAQWRELNARTRKGLEEMGQAAAGGTNSSWDPSKAPPAAP